MTLIRNKVWCGSYAIARISTPINLFTCFVCARRTEFMKSLDGIRASEWEQFHRKLMKKNWTIEKLRRVASQAKIWEFCHIIYNGVVNRAREQSVHLFRLALSHKIDSSKWFYAMYKFYLWCTIYDDDRINLISPQSFGYYTQYRAHSQSYTHTLYAFHHSQPLHALKISMEME